MIDGESVAVRLTEVEAYHGAGTGDVADPGSHARMGRTPRNATMWGEPGHLYVYLSHGIHSCVNVVSGPEGVAGGILLRAGEVVEGRDAATRRRLERRGVVRTDRDLARGPGRFGDAVGLRHPVHDGIDAITGAERGGAIARLELRAEPLDRPRARTARRRRRRGGHGCVSVALLDRRRPDGLGLPLGSGRPRARRPLSAPPTERGSDQRSEATAVNEVRRARMLLS